MRCRSVRPESVLRRVQGQSAAVGRKKESRVKYRDRDTKTLRENLDAQEGTGAKAAYLWAYYKIPIVGVLVAVFLVIYFVHAFMNRDAPEYIDVAMVNNYASAERGSAFYDGFAAQVGKDIEGKIVFDNSNFFNLAKSSEYTNPYYQKLVAKLENGKVDLLLLEEDNLEGIARGGRVMDLSLKKPIRRMTAPYADRVVEYTDDDGKKIPIALDVTDSAVLQRQGGFGEGKIYLAFGVGAKHYAADREFLDYLDLK